MGTWVIGIDPGISGAIALLDADGNPIKVCRPPLIQEVKNGRIRNKLNLSLTLELLAEMKAAAVGSRLMVYMEQVSSRPTDGGIQAFAFGKNVGHWEALVVAMGLPYNSVHPATWKKEMVAKTVAVPKLPGKMSKKQKSRIGRQVTQARKFAAIEAANRMFPSHAEWFKKSTGDGPAEALLIAEWGRRQENAIVREKPKVEKIVIAVPPLDPSEDTSEQEG